MSAEDDKTPEEQRAESASNLLGWFSIAVLVAIVLQIFGLAAGVFDWISRQLALVGADNAPPPKDPGWLDLIFGAQSFVGATRIFLVVVAFYLIAAVIHNVTRKAYPRSYGPVSLGSGLSDDLEGKLKKARDEIAQLKGERDELEEIADDQASALEKLEDELDEEKRQYAAMKKVVDDFLQNATGRIERDSDGPTG